jgi:hypothetical protein
MSFDVGPLVEGWNFVPGQVTVRQITGLDGKQKLQLRLDLGILQMELDGRPDGQHPFGHESLFDYYRSLAEGFAKKNSDELKFALDAEDCGKLQQEAVQYYHRYLGLFQLGDWRRVIRDTERNLAQFDFVEEHAQEEPLVWMFQQFRPYVLMMLARARAQEALTRKAHGEAVREVQKGLDEIRRFFERTHHAELVEASGEIRFLENWLQELQNNKPLSERDKLEKALAAAIEREDYETAASLRDSLKAL